MKKNQVYSLLSGVLFGIIAKVVDFIPGNSFIQYTGLKDLMNYFGVFVCIVCIIEYFSKNIKEGIINTFFFMISMIIGYYTIQSVKFRYFPMKYFVLWCFVAAFTPFLCYIIHLRLKDRISLAVIGVITPILLLGNEMYRLIRIQEYQNFTLWFDFIAIILLFIVLPKKKNVRIISLILFGLCSPLLFNYNIIRICCNLVYRLIF